MIDEAPLRATKRVLFIRRRKCGEIVAAGIKRRGGNHCVFIERIRIVVDPSPLEWRADLPAKNIRVPDFSPGVKARVKIPRCFFNVTDTNCQRQQPVDRTAEVVNRNGIVQRDRGNLGQSMDTRIRAARAVDMYRTALNGSDDGFEDTLDGKQIRLDLPSVEIGAVIGDVKLKAAHGG